MAYEKVLFKNLDTPGYTGDMRAYLRVGGYQGLKKALKELNPEEVIEIVKKSGLRGRGGAGFPTGLKWSFIPKDPSLNKYLCCNADESEPGTFKDRQLIEQDPHQMIEGMVIASYAIGAKKAFIYLRGEFDYSAKVLSRSLREAYEHGLLGKDILGTGFELDIILFRGAGAYICGEETALLESLEGKRGLPRFKPPFPATHGLYQKPTVVNNVETLANLPYIILRGPEWYSSMGTSKSTGTRIFSVSGHVKKPGNYEVPLGIPMRELIYDFAGGVRDDRKIKAIIPGGASANFLTDEYLDVGLDFESIAEAGSMLGSGGVTVMDETVCMVGAALNLMGFFSHETCGKCTPCREGTPWLYKVLSRIEHGMGHMRDLDLLVSLCGNIAGKTICAFGDAAVAPILSTLKHFRSEYETHIQSKSCPFSHKDKFITIGG